MSIETCTVVDTSKSRKSPKNSDLLGSTAIGSFTDNERSTSTQVSSVTVKSKKSRHREVVDEADAHYDALKCVEVKRKRKERHGREDSEGDAIIEGIKTVADEQRKRKRANEATLLDEPQPIVEDERKKSKKGKSHHASFENGTGETRRDTDKEEPSKERRRKTTGSQTGISNPDQDASLTDQARKALAYAYIQFDDPAAWKFHKARQNWLIRNVWSDQTIPELYMPLLTRYLTNVKGGVRENLITACKSILSQGSIAPADSVPPLSADSREIVTNNCASPKQLRARIVLDALT